VPASWQGYGNHGFTNGSAPACKRFLLQLALHPPILHCLDNRRPAGDSGPARSAMVKAILRRRWRPGREPEAGDGLVEQFSEHALP